MGNLDFRFEDGRTCTQPEEVRAYFEARGWVVYDAAAEERERLEVEAAAVAAAAVAAASAPALVEENVDDVLAAVGDDPVLAAAAWDAESAGRGRVTLLAALAEIKDPRDEGTVDESATAVGLTPPTT